MWCGSFLAPLNKVLKLVSTLLHKSDGICSMSKRLSYGLFKEAWEKALTKSNILSAWAKSDISPFNPGWVLHQLKPTVVPPPEDEPSHAPQDPKTPCSAKGIRHFKIVYHKNPNKVALRKFLQSC